MYPVFEPGLTELDYWPVLEKSQGSDIRTQSAFINDAWRLNDRISFNLGVRWDKNDATDAAGNVTSKDSKFSPRLAATYDIKGNGALRVTASYAKYVAALQETQAGSGATLAGAPADFYWYYDGPGINTGSGPYLTSQQALAQLFGWFQAAGCLPDPLSAELHGPAGRRAVDRRRERPDPERALLAERERVRLRRRRQLRGLPRQLPRPTSSAANTRTTTTSRRTRRPARS